MSFNSTITNRKKQLSCGHFDYNFSKNRCRQCATIQNTARRQEQNESSEEIESRQNLIDELDSVVSLYVRLKDADSEGWNTCYTCNKPFHYKQLHNGHCIGRANMGTRFLIENMRPQCPTCNSRHETEPEIFRKALEKENKGILEYLDDSSHSVTKLSVYDLKTLLSEYRFKLRLVQSKISK
jgi:hypothetical protein